MQEQSSPQANSFQALVCRLGTGSQWGRRLVRPKLERRCLEAPGSFWEPLRLQHWTRGGQLPRTGTGTPQKAASKLPMMGLQLLSTGAHGSAQNRRRRRDAAVLDQAPLSPAARVGSSPSPTRPR